MPKSYCYTVSLCGCLWGWVMLVPVGWVLVIFLWFIQASVSIQPPNPLITLLDCCPGEGQTSHV